MGSSCTLEFEFVDIEAVNRLFGPWVPWREGSVSAHNPLVCRAEKVGPGWTRRWGRAFA